MNKLNQAELLMRLGKDLNLFNSRLISLQIEYADGRLTATVRLHIDNVENARLLTLIFNNVQEYSFSYSRNYSFYNVETYKLTVSEKEIFLSLDPADDSPHRVPDDKDYISAEEVYGFLDIANLLM